MSEPNVYQLDLNLLKTFDALARERSVTNAANTIGLGQPAVSHALGRLRETMQDELFIRTGAGMEPTARANSLIGPIRAALLQIEAAVYGEEDFDAATSERTYTLAMSDYVAMVLLPTLLATLKGAVPKASIVVKTVEQAGIGRMLLDGEIDAGLGRCSEAAPWLASEPLIDDGEVCVFNPRLIGCGVPISLDALMAAERIAVSRSGTCNEVLDAHLRSHGIRPRAVLELPYFVPLAQLVQRSATVAIVPARLAEPFAAEREVAVSPLPFEAPRFEISLVSRASDARNRGTQALLTLLRSLRRTL